MKKTLHGERDVLLKIVYNVMLRGIKNEAHL